MRLLENGFWPSLAVLSDKNISLFRVASNLDEEDGKELMEGRWRPNVDDSEDSAVGGDVASLEFGDSAPAPGSASYRP